MHRAEAVDRLPAWEKIRERETFAYNIGTMSIEDLEKTMALTREFKKTVKARAERDPAFREALLTEVVEQLLAGDVETGKAVLRSSFKALTVSPARPACRRR
jgi:hypothetical protein